MHKFTLRRSCKVCCDESNELFDPCVDQNTRVKHKSGRGMHKQKWEWLNCVWLDEQIEQLQDLLAQVSPELQADSCSHAGALYLWPAQYDCCLVKLVTLPLHICEIISSRSQVRDHKGNLLFNSFLFVGA